MINDFDRDLLQPNSLAGYRSIRQKPANFRNEDSALFEKDWEKEIPGSSPITLSHLITLEDTLFSPFRLKVYDHLTHPQNLGMIAKLRRIFKLYKPGAKIPKGIWISDLWAHNYFHWITESLTRLMALEGKYGDYIIILPSNLEQFPYIKESLTYFGYSHLFIKPDQIFYIQKLVSFERTAPSFNFHVKVINNLRYQFIGKIIKNKPYRMVYLSRRNASKRRIINEEDLIPILDKYGFETHDFELYTFHQQLALMCQTKYLVSIHGAGLTNMLYMRKGGKVLELRFENDTNNNCFYVLASEMGHSYWYTQNTAESPKIHLNSNMVVNLESFELTLKKFTEHK